MGNATPRELEHRNHASALSPYIRFQVSIFVNSMASRLGGSTLIEIFTASAADLFLAKSHRSERVTSATLCALRLTSARNVPRSNLASDKDCGMSTPRGIRQGPPRHRFTFPYGRLNRTRASPCRLRRVRRHADPAPDFILCWADSFFRDARHLIVSLQCARRSMKRTVSAWSTQ